jgi:hypothetical protein
MRRLLMVRCSACVGLSLNLGIGRVNLGSRLQSETYSTIEWSKILAEGFRPLQAHLMQFHQYHSMHGSAMQYYGRLRFPMGTCDFLTPAPP